MCNETTKEILDRFYSENYSKSYARLLDKKEVWKEDLINASPNDLSEICLTLGEKYYGVGSFRNMRSQFSTFYEYLIDEGYVKVNPFNIYEMLSFNILCKELVERSPSVVLYKEDIDNIIQLIEKSNCEESDLKILLIRGFFEGIPYVEYFADMIYENINFNNKTIKIKEGVVNKFSNKFFESLKKYNENRHVSVIYHNFGKECEVNFNRVNFENRVLKYDDSNLRGSLQIKSETKYRNFILKKIRKQIEEIVNIVCENYDFKFTITDLTMSGFLNYVYDNINSYKGFVETCCKHRPFGLISFGKAYGMKNPTRLKSTCYIHVHKSKWFQEYMLDENIPDDEKEKYLYVVN